MFFFLIYLIYFWLCWVFVVVHGLSLVAVSGGYSSLRCVGLSLRWLLLLWSTGSRCAVSVVVACGCSGSVACGIFPDQGLNPCPPHWQVDPQPLRHQGSPIIWFLFFNLLIWCITLIDLYILKNPCIPGINPTWSWCTILSMCCWILFAISLSVKLLISPSYLNEILAG